ncbi:cell division protein FtsA [Desulfotalea psychrophila]|uniref:Cell division protein FtsA n=1 Tax=Desulfotalea psychrophila (strain LSv54 / DSM 12343) TaxID=177439 RepID=Q6AJ57_DESPS|nr:probable cell division protein FtsA [Desulfotalea psychrophila LSv54]
MRQMREKKENISLEAEPEMAEQQESFGELEIKKRETHPSEIREDRDLGEIVIGLDIGTTKICCVVGELLDDSLYILGVGTVPSSGLKKGVVYNIESTVQSIQKALRLAEESSDYELKNVPAYVGIAGDHIKGFNSPGIVAINDREIKKSDLEAVRRAAQTVKISQNQNIIHVLPQEYMVDDNVGIQNPVGMTGVRLATNVHIVTADVGAIHNLVTCCEKAGVKVASLVLESVASAHAVLTREEKENGVALVDIGGGTTDTAVFHGGTVRQTSQINFGGHNLTNDISVGLLTSLGDAEWLKENYGGAIASVVKSNYVVEVPKRGDKNPVKTPQKFLVEILEARTKEILEMVDEALIESGQKTNIGHGIVLTGGTALLPNIADLAEQIFDLPVRVGYPEGLTGRVENVYTPRCTTAVGLVLFGREEHQGKGLVDHSVFTKICRFFKNIM